MSTLKRWNGTEWEYVSLPTAGMPSTLGFAEITANQGGIPATTMTVVTGLSVVVTVPAGRRLRVELEAAAQSTANGLVEFVIKQDGTIIQFLDNYLTTVNSNKAFNKSVVLTPSAGSHTYTVEVYFGAGTGQVSAAAANPAYLLVEDITGAGWPTGTAIGAGQIASEPWTNYTPTVSQSVAVTATISRAKYTRIGRTIHVSFSIVPTSAGTTGNSLFISLPVPATGTEVHVGGGTIYDASTAVRYNGTWETGGSASTVWFVGDWSGSSTWGGSPNLPIQSGDLIRGYLTYEAAS